MHHGQSITGQYFNVMAAVQVAQNLYQPHTNTMPKCKELLEFNQR